MIDPFTPEGAEGLVAITEAAALAQADPALADEERLQAAIDAMHAGLLRQRLTGRLVVGKGLGQGLGRLYTGETLTGDTTAPALDLAVDPVEGTSDAGEGGTAIAVLAVAPAGTLFDPAPGFYIEKLVAPPKAAEALDPAWPIAQRLAALAEALGKPVGELRIAVLEKPRHRALVAALTAAGCEVVLKPAGDVVLAVLAALPEGPYDALMGTGGFAEGLMAACAARAVGAVFFSRFDPQLQSEARALKQAGIDTQRWFALEELVRSRETAFVATGVHDGVWLKGITRGDGWIMSESFLAIGPTGERRLLRRTWKEEAPC